MSESTEEISSHSRPSPTIYPFAFTGKGAEYFRIWIVNIALTLLTLGIYSAWAKVRNNRYIFGNTSVANGHFDYHADPKVILRGRIIAVIFLLIYLAASSFFPIAGAIILLLVFIAVPWIVVRSLAFNAHNSGWRNVRFSFIGKPLGAAGAYLGWPLVGVLTFGLGIPFAWYKAAKFGVNNHRVGQTPFQLNAGPAAFYAILMYLILAGLLAAVVVGLLAVTSMSGIDAANPELSAGQFAAFALFGLVYLALFNLFSALRFKAVYDKLALGENRIHNNMSIPGYLMVAITNTLAMLFTLGLFYPWAKVRMTKYLVESLTLEAVDVDSFVASAEAEQSAFGEELGDAFDLGIGV
jgi:uncharacterized membrane protein YjgN (DUF898 family)